MDLYPDVSRISINIVRVSEAVWFCHYCIGTIVIMLISIDESGTFAHSPKLGSWCVVAAYTFPERIKSKVYAALTKAKALCGRGPKQEIKLKDLHESDYFEFLANLSRVGGVLFAVATDAGLCSDNEIITHRNTQAKKIRANVPKMIYEEGKIAVASFADEIESLSPQLYTQLMCQAILIRDTLASGVLFYVQRDPKTLRRFVWRIDQKNSKKNTFERAFEKFTPGMIQTFSFTNPMEFLEGADYSYFRPFEFMENEYPEHLQEELGHSAQQTINIGKILRDDMEFPDSKHDQSVQVADLLASGIRRCLRGGFKDNHMAATLIGRLMTQNTKQDNPLALTFVHFCGGTFEPNKIALDTAVRMTRNSQSLLYRT